ncbi:MAG TPA: aspartyl/asparaginyl beta-hydroxylase domain-containing protein [Verrucomicrobiae bacterium]|jgi:hypothetical protein|nr:aspartyl/asparaginyl beta-hydroxylase domain-containing protein [Verrucomicrobiae bacterium]
MRCVRLPFVFEPARLCGDLRRVEPGEWIGHFNSAIYGGQWSGAALRSREGDSGNLLPEASDSALFQDTVLLGRCPYFREVLDVFKCPVQAARLLRLHAHSNIAEHRDNEMQFEDGVVRLHIPIVTTDEVHFYLDGARLAMAPGECWYTNVNLPHSVDNRGAVDRVHLVIDCSVNDWLRDAFAKAAPQPRDHYAARLTLPAPPPFATVLNALLRWAGENRASFETEKNTLVLKFAGVHTWQFRLRLPDASPANWTALLESSPDPDGQHRRDYDALIGALAGELPGLAIEHRGLP